MRDTDRPDPAFHQPLGEPVKKPTMPEPHRKVNESGTVRKDPETGKFYTANPKNEAAV